MGGDDVPARGQSHVAGLRPAAAMADHGDADGGDRRLGLRGQSSAGGGLAGAHGGGPRRHHDHLAGPVAQHAAGWYRRGGLEARDGRPSVGPHAGDARFVALGVDREHDQKPRELESVEDLLKSANTGPASASADVPALLQAAHDYIKANKAGRTEVWICSDIRENDWNADSGRWQALRDGFLEFPQGVRFHLLAYPQNAADNLSVRVTNVRRRKTADSAELLVSLRLSRAGDSDGTEQVPVQFEIDGARSEMTVELVGRESELRDHPHPAGPKSRPGMGPSFDPGGREPGG